MKQYDGLYIFAGHAKDEVLDKMIERAQSEITRLSGTILSTEVLGRRNFARTMKKRDNGVYVRVRFELDPAQMTALVSRYHLVEDVFRVQFLAVDAKREAALERQAEVLQAREEARIAAEEAAAAKAAEVAAEAAAAAEAEAIEEAAAAEIEEVVEEQSE